MPFWQNCPVSRKHVSNEAKTMSETNEQFFLAGEVAKIKGVTPATVRAWEDRGILRAIRTPSGTRMFSRQDVDNFSVPSRRQAK
jgi:hypothetical protein